MTQAQVQATTTTVARRTVGIVADGVVKVVLAAAFTVGAGPLGHRLGVETWLMVVCGVAMLIGGGVEIGFVRSRPLRTYRRLMVAYDAGWVLTALAGLLLARQGSSAGGEVWIGYQTAAPVVFAALLAVAGPRRVHPGN
jgi:hypothetical protein